MIAEQLAINQMISPMIDIVLARPGLNDSMERRWSSIPPLGLGLLAGSLRARGFKVAVVDGKMLNHVSALETAAEILRYGAPYVGLSAMTVDFPMARAIAKIVKNNSHATLILGGAHANSLPERTLEEATEFDYLIAGEGEQALPNLLLSLQNGQDLRIIPGLFRRSSNGPVICDASPTYNMNMANMVFPAWDLFPKVNTYPVMWERGCPYQCAFCSHSMSRRVRSRPLSDIVGEITWLTDELGVRDFTFQDETFGLHPEPTLELLRHLRSIHETTGARFSAQTRVDKVTPALAYGMRKAGFKFIELGVESGTPEVLVTSGKDITLSQVHSAVTILKKSGLKVWVNLILGLPNETRVTILKTLRFVMKLRPHRISVSLIVAYPGSQIFQWAEEGKYGYRMLTRDWSKFDKYLGPSLELEGLSHRELRFWQIMYYFFIYGAGCRINELFRIGWLGRGILLDRLRPVKVSGSTQEKSHASKFSEMERLPTARIIPQKYGDHVELFKRYGNLSKYANLCRAMLNYAFRRTKIGSLPPILKVEVSNRCNVKCLYCYAKKSGAEFDFDLYEHILDILGPKLFEVSLHDIGEPLLSERICQFISAARMRNIGTSISSSLSVCKPDSFWEELVDSGLDHLVVAIDGVTPDTYNRYRTQGDLGLALCNLERIVAEKKRVKSHLIITWQMIDFPWNRNEQGTARRMALRYGCDHFRLIHEENVPRHTYYTRRIIRNRNCLLSYLMLIVDARGNVKPCCNLYQGICESIPYENIIARFEYDGFSELWNGTAFQMLRSKRRIIERDYCRYCQEM